METKRSYADQLRQADQQRGTARQSVVRQQPDINRHFSDKYLRYTDQLRHADQQLKRSAK